MEEELEQRRSDALVLCNRLLAALAENREDAHSFFSGEVYRAYIAAPDKAENKIAKIRNKIRYI